MLIHKQEDPEAAHAAETAILNDDSLSYAARGVLLRILRHAPEWDTNAKGLSALAKSARADKGETVAAVRSCFRELEGAGYLVRAYVRMGGRGYGTQMSFYDTRQSADTSSPASRAQNPAYQAGPVVYVVGETGSSKVKIGQTKDMSKRMAAYQTHSPVQLNVLWTHRGTSVLEHLLHQQFKSLRVHGEWFEFGDKDPVATIDRFARTISPERIEDIERELKERGVTAAFVWTPPSGAA